MSCESGIFENLKNEFGTIQRKKLNIKSCTRVPNSYTKRPIRFTQDLKRYFPNYTAPKTLEIDTEYKGKNIYYLSRVYFGKIEAYSLKSKKQFVEHRFALCPICDPFENIRQAVFLKDVNTPVGPKSIMDCFYDNLNSGYSTHMEISHGIIDNGQKKAPQPFVGYLTGKFYRLVIICPCQDRVEKKSPCLGLFPYDPKLKNPFKSYFRHFGTAHNAKSVRNQEEYPKYTKTVTGADGNTRPSIFYPFDIDLFDHSMRVLRRKCQNSRIYPIELCSPDSYELAKALFEVKSFKIPKLKVPFKAGKSKIPLRSEKGLELLANVAIAKSSVKSKTSGIHNRKSHEKSKANPQKLSIDAIPKSSYSTTSAGAKKSQTKLN